MAHTRRIPLVTIVGPTAVGKTALGIALAEAFGGEIVSADSRQFYRQMTIGTAKPTPDELARARHHLIDIADPDETVGLAQFLDLAHAAIRDIDARGCLPFVVGGTGQYVRALLEGWQVPEVPPDPALRDALTRQAESDPDGLWARLLELDPEVAGFIDPRNLRRVVRALEVTLVTGKPFSSLRRRVPPPYRTLRLGLTLERTALYARADARVDTMIAAGLAEELTRLLAAGYDWSLPAMSALGYAQWQPYFAGEATLPAVVERIKLDTHAYIRRQYAWFRPGRGDVIWYDASDPDLIARASQTVATFLASPGPARS